SAFMATELQLRVRLGRELPEGVAIDRDGRPTRDPVKARDGALLPFGGYKGFGLGLVVQALGVLGGAGLVPGAEDGYLFIAFRPDLLVPLEQAKREVSALIARVKATPRPPVARGDRDRRARLRGAAPPRRPEPAVAAAPPDGAGTVSRGGIRGLSRRCRRRR